MKWKNRSRLLSSTIRIQGFFKLVLLQFVFVVKTARVRELPTRDGHNPLPVSVQLLDACKTSWWRLRPQGLRISKNILISARGIGFA
jgi:hypothetical protein